MPPSRLLLFLLLAGCASTTTPPPLATKPPEIVQPPIVTTPEPSPAAVNPAPLEPQKPPVTISTEAQAFAAMPGWKGSDNKEALSAFLRSCKALSKDPQGLVFWQKACAAAKKTRVNTKSARDFFETYFYPVQVRTKDDKGGLLTAYYEPELEVRSKPSPGFDEPVYARPEDLVTFDPKRFNAKGFGGRKLMGRVVDGLLVPYYSRKEVVRKGGAAIAWGRPADVFFLQVQGSGRLRFEDGHVLRAAFAGHNGHQYTSIGRELISRGELTPQQASKGSIERWMKQAGQKKSKDLMNHNKRYVFFAPKPVLDDHLGPTGTQGVPLTSGVSLAVDPALYQLGTPIWIETRLPQNEKDWRGTAKNFLAIAQDTGGAIKGEARGDLFLGSGDKAGRLAGIVKHPARWWILMPRKLDERPAEPEPES